MRRPFKIFVLSSFFAFSIICAGAAQEINKISEEFYSGLADIIEDNMNNPDACVAKVEDYYQANQDKIKEIRAAAEKAMEQMAPQMGKYMSMTQEEAEALAKKEGAQGETIKPRMLPEAERYSDALKTFSMKHLEAGTKIAMESMQLIPGFKQ